MGNLLVENSGIEAGLSGGDVEPGYRQPLGVTLSNDRCKVAAIVAVCRTEGLKRTVYKVVNLLSNVGETDWV